MTVPAASIITAQSASLMPQPPLSRRHLHLADPQAQVDRDQASQQSQHHQQSQPEQVVMPQEQPGNIGDTTQDKKPINAHQARVIALREIIPSARSIMDFPEIGWCNSTFVHVLRVNP
jgi:hypothetical protein